MSNIPIIGLVSLGCAKNLVDTQRLTSVLVAMGYQIADSYHACDLVIINTCGFIGPAVQESLDTITQALEENGKVIVTGCMGTKAEQLFKQFPKIRAVIGPGKRASVVRSVIKLLGQPSFEHRQQLDSAGILLTPPHYAYLKIAEGCDHRCSFCIIPSLRGAMRSRSIAHVFNEAQVLCGRGVREFMLIAQDSSDYGRDLKDGSNLSSLCEKLSNLGAWLRVHYVYPSAQSDKLIELMAQGKVLPYIDVPFQHVNQEILKAMKRPGSLERTAARIQKWRQLVPDLSIRSTFITGFPGESQAQFEELYDFLREIKLDRVGVFPYSNVEGATANSIYPSIDEEIREQRAEQLMQLQAQISFAKLEQRLGKSYEVLIDYVGDDGIAVGRSKYEAPDVDGTITIVDAPALHPGSLIRATIIDHDEHDLTARFDQDLQQSIAFTQS